MAKALFLLTKAPQIMNRLINSITPINQSINLSQNVEES